MEILGYFLALIMGFILGLLGGGGSILSVPILIYVMTVEPVIATAYSLFVVGFTALAGGWRKFKQGLVALEEGVYFAVPSILTVFFTRLLIMPALPGTILRLGTFTLSKDLFIITLFAFVMLLAAVSMLRKRDDSLNSLPDSPKVFKVILQGSLAGLIAGLVGAGGGFLIVPALVLLIKLPVKKAIGTSLLIIALQSLIGFGGDLLQGLQVEWNILLPFTLFSVLGMVAGLYVSKYVNPQYLKKMFGWFILLFGMFILAKELFL